MDDARRGDPANRTFLVSSEYNGARADAFRRDATGEGRRGLKALFQDGRVAAGGRTIRPGDILTGGESLEILPRDPEDPPAPDRPDSRVLFHLPGGRPVRSLYEFDTALVIDKPSGVAVLGGHRPNDLALMKGLDSVAGTSGPDARRWRFVHRLDRDTSGCLLVARTPAAADSFEEQFRTRAVDKAYQIGRAHV